MRISDISIRKERIDGQTLLTFAVTTDDGTKQECVAKWADEELHPIAVADYLRNVATALERWAHTLKVVNV